VTEVIISITLRKIAEVKNKKQGQWNYSVSKVFTKAYRECVKMKRTIQESFWNRITKTC
jgi:hypothetical protein